MNKSNYSLGKSQAKTNDTQGWIPKKSAENDGWASKPMDYKDQLNAYKRKLNNGLLDLLAEERKKEQTRDLKLARAKPEEAKHLEELFNMERGESTMKIIQHNE